MTESQLYALLSEAMRRTGYHEFVVIGSLSIWGMAPSLAAFSAQIPDDMSMSNDLDAYATRDPGRLHDLVAELGVGSTYHHAHDVYLDPVTPLVATLPQGWQQRMHQRVHEGMTVSFLEPHDAAVSKLVRGEPHDMRWVHAGLRAGLISKATLMQRYGVTIFIDEQEAQQTKLRIAAL